MNPFRLFLAAALSFMTVDGNESAYVGRDETRALEWEKNSDDGEDDDELTPALPEYGQRQCFEPTEIGAITNKDYENFNKYKKDVENWPTIEKYIKRKKVAKVKDCKSPIDDPKEMSEETYKAFHEKYLCDEVCRNKGDRCVKVYPSSGKTDQPSFQCLPPCCTQCSQQKWLRCGGFLEDPPSYPISWWNHMNQQCWQVEQSQTGSWFLRTTCSCPSRDYRPSNGCDDTYAMASLSNCIQGYLSLSSEINFQNVKNVQFGIVKTTNPADGDVDFQGTIERSMFCKIDSAEDVEFGGGNSACAATFKDNVVFDVEMADDIQFEEGTTVDNNIIFKLKANDDFKFQEDNDGVYTTTITNNKFKDVVVDGECEFDTNFVPDDLVLAPLNYCLNFNEAGGNLCSNNPIQAGFSCTIT